VGPSQAPAAPWLVREQTQIAAQLVSRGRSPLKRAAVKFGVGRYLYRVPRQWRDYDPVKEAWAEAPELPAWARPSLSCSSDEAGTRNGRAAAHV
jgi:hypothetical protein